MKKRKILKQKNERKENDMCFFRKIFIFGMISSTMVSCVNSEEKPTEIKQKNIKSNIKNSRGEIIMKKLINVKKISGKFPIWLAENQGSNVVSVCIGFDGAGDIGCDKNEPNMSSLVSRLLTEGAGDLKREKFKRFLRDKGIELNVISDSDNFFVIFRTERKFIEDAFHAVKMILLDPRFDKDDLERAKQETIIGINQAMHDPVFFAHVETFDLIFEEDHPYYISIKKILEKIPGYQANNLKKFMKENIIKQNFHVTACGDINDDELEKYSSELYNSLPDGVNKKYDKRSIKNPGKSSKHYMDVPQTVINFAHQGVDYKNPDFYAVDLALKAFAGGDFETRFMTEIREKRGLVYNGKFTASPGTVSDIILGKTATKTESAKQVIDLIKSEFKLLVDKGLSKDEFDFHKQSIMGAFILKLDNTADIARILMAYMLQDMDSNFINERNKKYEQLTLEEVNKVIKKYLNPESLTFVTVGGEKNVNKESR